MQAGGSSISQSRVKRAPIGILLASAVAASLMAAPARAATATVVVLGPAIKIRPTDLPTGPGDATIFAAKNEFESFQVVTEAGGSPVDGLNVTLLAPLSGPGGTIPADHVTIYREGYYNVVTPSDPEGDAGLWPDPLIPSVDPWYHQARTAFPIDVPAGENRVAWIDVQVPPRQAAGQYNGSILVSSSGGLSVTVPVALTVLNVSLPSTASLPSFFGMSWYGACPAFYGAGDYCVSHIEDGWRLKALFEQAALDDRLTISYPQYQPLSSDPRQLPLFEQYTLPLLNGTAPTRLAGARISAIQLDGGAFTSYWKQEAQAKGFAARGYFYVCDEPHTWPDAWAVCDANAAAVKAAWPKANVLITTSIDDVNAMGEESLLDTMVPVINEMEPKNDRNHRPDYDPWLGLSARNRLWMYTSCESEGCSDAPPDDPGGIGWAGYAIDQPASEARAMGWLPFTYTATAELYYRVDLMLATAWTDSFANGGNGDGTLFYPGTPDMVGGTDPIPIESMRMKLFRDGREDYEYLRFLQRHGQGAQAQAIAVSLFPATYDTDRTDGDVAGARTALADLIVSIVGGPGPP